MSPNSKYGYKIGKEQLPVEQITKASSTLIGPDDMSIPGEKSGNAQAGLAISKFDLYRFKGAEGSEYIVYGNSR